MSSYAELAHCPASCCACAQRIALFTLVSCSTLGRPLSCSVLCKHSRQDCLYSCVRSHLHPWEHVKIVSCYHCRSFRRSCPSLSRALSRLYVYCCPSYFQSDQVCMTVSAGLQAPAQKKSKVDASAAQGSSTVFVKNLPWSADEDTIAEFFGDCGTVANIRIGECRQQVHLVTIQRSSMRVWVMRVLQILYIVPSSVPTLTDL